MNRNILGFCIGIVFCTSLSLNAQQVSTATVKSEGRHARIERITEKGHDIVRFYNKDGKKTKEVQLGEIEKTARLGKNKSFNAATFELKISSTLAGKVESLRKRSGRDIEVMRRTSKEAETSENGKFLVVEDSQGDFIDYADATEGESSGEVAESVMSNTIYDLQGKQVLTISNEEGWHPRCSNTGKYFVVTLGESAGLAILDIQKNRLAEVSFVGPVYFSENDRYILLVDDLGEAGKAAITVYNTESKELELRKVIVDVMVFRGVDFANVSEDRREMTIQHVWNAGKQEERVDTVRF